jgi:anti-sigma-K factor RskA
MNLRQHPELLDRLAAAYALGTLRGGAKRRFETLAREQAPVRAAALIWQSRIASLNELQSRAEPGPEVWTRIHNLVRADQERHAMRQARTTQTTTAPAASTAAGWWRNLALWRTAAASGMAVAVLAVTGSVLLREQLGGQIAGLQAQLQATPQVGYVAVLTDAQSAASMLVTFDPKARRLTLQRVGDYREADDRSLQLWALPPGAPPQSLGVLGRDKLLRLVAGEADVQRSPALAISLEPRGGVPGERGPTGPVLFKGAVIQPQL